MGLAVGAGDEINRISDGHGNAKVERYAPVLTVRTGNFFEPVGDIRLSSDIKVHIRINGKTISAFHADATAFSIRLQRSDIDAERIGFTDRALHAGQPLFYLIYWKTGHLFPQLPAVYARP